METNETKTKLATVTFHRKESWEVRTIEIPIEADREWVRQAHYDGDLPMGLVVDSDMGYEVIEEIEDKT